MPLSLHVIFRDRALEWVAFWREMSFDLRHAVGSWPPFEQGECCVSWHMSYGMLCVFTTCKQRKCGRVYRYYVCIIMTYYVRMIVCVWYDVCDILCVISCVLWCVCFDTSVWVCYGSSPPVSKRSVCVCMCVCYAFILVMCVLLWHIMYVWWCVYFDTWVTAWYGSSSLVSNGSVCMCIGFLCRLCMGIGCFVRIVTCKQAKCGRVYCMSIVQIDCACLSHVLFAFCMCISIDVLRGLCVCIECFV